MTDVVLGRDVGVTVCEILGLNPNQVGSINFNIEHDEVFGATVQYYPDGVQTGKFIALLKKYEPSK